MPTIRTVDLDARSRLTKRTTGYDARAPYREAIARLGNDRALELQPEESETIRKLRLLVRRAAKEIGRDVKYGETDEGSLVVWLDTRTTSSGKRRGRPQDRVRRHPAPTRPSCPVRHLRNRNGTIESEIATVIKS